jgi:hypothetical protein
MALNPSSIPTLAALLVNAGLALYLLHHGPRRAANRTFALLLGALAAHAAVTVVLKNAPSPEAAAAAVRFQSVLLAAAAPAFVHFTWVFPKGEPPGPKVLLLIYGALLPLAVASFAGEGPVQVIETPLGPTSRFLDKPVVHYYALLGVFLLLALYGLFRIYRSHRDGGVVEKRQIRWVVAGMLAGLAGGALFKVALPELAGVDIPGSGSASAILPALFTTYAIVRYRFLAIEPVVERKLETRPRFSPQPGVPLLVSAETGPAAFKDLVDHGAAGLAISRTHPAKLRGELGLEKTPAVWLSGEAEGGTASIERPEEVLRTIRHFVSQAKSSPEGSPGPAAAVWLDGLEYLTTRFGFEAALRVVQDVRDLATAKGAVLLFTVDLRGMGERERALLERECKPLGPS